MKECPKCGREYNDEKTRCSFCGDKLKTIFKSSYSNDRAPLKSNRNSKESAARENSRTKSSGTEAPRRTIIKKERKNSNRTLLGFVFAAIIVGVFVFGVVYSNIQLQRLPFHYTLHSGPEPQHSVADDYRIPVADSFFVTYDELNNGLAPGDSLIFFANKKSVFVNVDDRFVYKIKSLHEGGRGLFIVPEFKLLAFRVADKADKDLRVLIRALNWQWWKVILEALKYIFYAAALMAAALFICSHLIDISVLFIDNDHRTQVGLKFGTVLQIFILLVGMTSILGAYQLWPDWSRLKELKNSEQDMGMGAIFLARIPEVFAPYDRLYLWGNRYFGVMIDGTEWPEGFRPGSFNADKQPISPAAAILTLKPNTREVRVAHAASDAEIAAAKKYAGGMQEAFLKGKEITLGGNLYYRLERSKKIWPATYFPSIILILLAILSLGGGIIWIRKKMQEADRQEEIKAREKEFKEKTSRDLADKLRQKFDELQFEAERSSYERTDEFRINYVHRNLDQIIGHKDRIEREHKEFFFSDKEFLAYCRENGGEEIIAYKEEPFERLKMALDLDLRRPAPGSIQEKMQQAVENIWVDESSGLLRVALRKDFTKRYSEIGDFSDALAMIEDSYNKIRQNSQRRLERVK